MDNDIDKADVQFRGIGGFGGVIPANQSSYTEQVRKEERGECNGIFAYHGTNKENALRIMKEGFVVGTHFAHHLEEALEFGGSWVFRVKLEDKPLGWQFLNEKHISPERIERLTQYRPIVRIGTQPHMTRKVDNKRESRNLTGVPLYEEDL